MFTVFIPFTARISSLHAPGVQRRRDSPQRVWFDMNRLVAALATLACMIGLTVAPVTAASAASVTVGEANWSVALTFPDLQWSSEGCHYVPVNAVVTGATVESWTFGGWVTSSEQEGEGVWLIDFDKQVTKGTGSFTFRHAIPLCPGYDPAGIYDVVGEVGVQLTGAAGWSWVPYRTTFSVGGIPTTTTLAPIVLAGEEARFTGSIAATPSSPATFRGCRYAGVSIQAYQAGDWEEIGSTDLSPDGTFIVRVPVYRLTWAQYRARMSGGLICEPSLSGPQTLSVKLPMVTASVVGKQSKIKVDIAPSLGRRAWTFRVQRQLSDESWRTLRAYRTRGARETRTVDLGKGTYRIWLRAQFGYAETFTDSVSLER